MRNGKIKGFILASALLLWPAGSHALILDKVQNAIEHSELGAIIAEIQDFKASNIHQFVEQLGKEIEQIDNLVSVTQNTYNSVQGIIHSNNVLDAVYSGADLLANNSITGSSKTVKDITDASKDLLNIYRQYLSASQYFASVDRNFDFNGACDQLHYVSGLLTSSFGDVDNILLIIKKGSDSMAAQKALEELLERQRNLADRVAWEIQMMTEEELNKMRIEAMTNGLSSYPEDLQVRTMGEDGGKVNKPVPRRGSALKYDKITGTGQDKITGTGQEKETSFYDYDKDANETFKEAIPTVLDIASIVTLVLAMLFTVRNYARKHSGEHGSDNALLKTGVGAFILIAIIQIVRAIFVSL